ncbi:MAG TPA: hypothetical protein VF938_03315 [Candidatus Angelobacter sp.]
MNTDDTDLRDCQKPPELPELPGFEKAKPLKRKNSGKQRRSNGPNPNSLSLIPQISVIRVYQWCDFDS